MSRLSSLRRATLARKFILLTSAMILATALVLLLFILEHEREYAYRELLGHGLSVATIMAQNSEFGIYTEDRATLGQIVDSVGTDPDVAYAAVLSRTGKPLAQAVKTPGWTVPSPVLPSGPTGTPEHRNRTCPENGMAYIDVVAAVISPAMDDSSLDAPAGAAGGRAAPMGYVRLVLSQAQLQKNLKQFLVSSIAVTGLLILVGISLTVWLTRRIVRPVQTLGEAALALSEGRMNMPLDLRSRDEIGELARSFDTMIRRLKDSRDAVEQRTGELIDANAQLQQEIAERRRVEEILRQRQHVLQSVYEMGTTLGQSFQSLCEQVAAHLAGFLRIPLVVVQQLEEGQAKILAAARDEALVDAEQITVDDAAWVSIEEINALCLAQGLFREIHRDGPEQGAEAFRTLAGFPIKNSKGVMVGLITLVDRASRSLEKDDLHLIEIYANFMAYAMEQRDLEVRLQSAQKTQVIAQLASGVAHEVRNPLNALLSLSEALFMDLGDNPEDKEFLVQIRVQVDRLSALMQDLLELGKPIKPAQLKPEPLPPLCQQAIQMWKESHADATQKAHLILPQDPEQLSVLADSLRLQQVLINLLDNAAQHSPEKGRILMVLDRPTVGFGRIQVIDEGSGIPEGVLPHVFEPFFTTRKRGTGLGMSLVRHIVENHQGYVAIWNNVPGPGCTVEIRIPLADAAGGPKVV